MKTNHQKIKKIVKELIAENNKFMQSKIDKALKSGALNIEEWDENNDSYIIPKIITIALYEEAATQYSAEGTFWGKYIKKEVENLRYFL